MSASSGDTETSRLLASSSPVADSNMQGATELKVSTIAFQIGAAMISFSTLGLFNSSIGAVLPLISSHYSLTDLHVSLLFITGPIGYISAAYFSDSIHYKFGQRGIAVVGPVFQILATSAIAMHPSFGWILASFAVQGLGTGLLDGSWCAWAGSMRKANTISGLLHGSYSVGGAAGPFFVALITAKHYSWWSWYFILSFISIVELVLLVYAFRSEDGVSYRQRKHSSTPSDTKIDSKEIFEYSATWFCSLYFLTYVGTETAISGWVVSFMLRNRLATTYLANLASSGFWTGMAIGRLLLGFCTDRIGVRCATVLYFAIAILLEIAFAASNSAGVSVFIMTLLGFIMGPLFPSGVVVLTRLLPAKLHIAAVSFVASLGQIGGAFLPFAIGAVVQQLGIGIFRYAILLQTFLALLVWIMFSRLRVDAEFLQHEGRHERDQ